MIARPALRAAVLLAACLALACLAPAPVPLPADGRTGSLHILLTNDDGYGSVGIETLKEALRGAGHRVTLVAPSGNRSGSSASMTVGPIRVERKAEAEYSADCTPAACALLGLSAMADPSSPFDLLVSGTNAGVNVGLATGLSGTVGATTTAVGFGDVAAIAVSAGEIGNKGEPDHRKHFEATAGFAVKLIDRLVETAGGRHLLPPGTRLNVNVPGIPWDEIRGVRLAVQGTNAPFGLGFEEESPDVYAPVLRAPSRTRADAPGSDAVALAEGYVTVVLLDADYTAPAGQRTEIEKRLGGFGKARSSE